MSMHIDPATELAIAGLVRGTIETAVRGGDGLNREEIDAHMDHHPLLGEPSGAFVTIYVDGQLRGCLGEVTPEDTLAHVLVRCASRVPLHDYRFSAVRESELARLSFDVSVLSPPEPLTDVSAIVIGRDGLIVRREEQSGLLLPQVPVDYQWDVPTFLTHLWIKAGIDSDVPLDQVRLWRFTCQKISSRILDGAGPENPAE